MVRIFKLREIVSKRELETKYHDGGVTMKNAEDFKKDVLLLQPKHPKFGNHKSHNSNTMNRLVL